MLCEQNGFLSVVALMGHTSASTEFPVTEISCNVLSAWTRGFGVQCSHGHGAQGAVSGKAEPCCLSTVFVQNQADI